MLACAVLAAFGQIVVEAPDFEAAWSDPPARFEVADEVRTARVVLDETRYMPSRLEAVHACGDAGLLGSVGLRWGGLLATGAVSMSGGPAVPASLPRLWIRTEQSIRRPSASEIPYQCMWPRNPVAPR